MKILIVVDMQKDFITGPLGNEQTRAVVPNVVKRIEEALQNGEKVWYTFDTHGEDYMDTQEGKYLPVPHCIYGTDGWELIDEINNLALEHSSKNCLSKPTFGAYNLPDIILQNYPDEDEDPITDITLIGVCTDICVISNALLLKSYFCGDLPVDIHVDARCCAGVTPEKHKAALEVMKSCQILVEGE